MTQAARHHDPDYCPFEECGESTSTESSDESIDSGEEEEDAISSSSESEDEPDSSESEDVDDVAESEDEPDSSESEDGDDVAESEDEPDSSESEDVPSKRQRQSSPPKLLHALRECATTLDGFSELDKKKQKYVVHVLFVMLAVLLYPMNATWQDAGGGGPIPSSTSPTTGRSHARLSLDLAISRSRDLAISRSRSQSTTLRPALARDLALGLTRTTRFARLPLQVSEQRSISPILEAGTSTIWTASSNGSPPTAASTA